MKNQFFKKETSVKNIQCVNVAELLLDVTDNLTLDSGSGERVTALSHYLHEAISQITTTT